ncbi:MAG: RNA-binding cell elongation regulator Jag/EloR [Acidimicrobiia bacterium]
MEWIETTAKSVEEAKDLALDRLGVDEQEAEFEILEEPRQGIFGRMKGEARIRARVRPVQARAKIDRRDRRRGGRGGESRSRQSDESASANTPSRTDSKPEPTSPRSDKAGSRVSQSNPETQHAAQTPESAGAMDQASDEIDLTVDEQAEIITEFLTGLLEAFELDATITSEKIDEETIEIDIQGDQLGLLVGPRGNTLQAVYDLSRTVTQRRASGRHEGRVRLDVAGYRSRRRSALEEFVKKICDEVLESGVSKVLEPMSSVDRKIVHDTATSVAGIRTSSEGDEPRRRVVIHKAD